MAAHIKHIIELLKDRKVLFSNISPIWENTDGCTKQYQCATALYLLSMLSHPYNFIIERGVVAPWHGIEAVHGFNATDKWFLSMTITTVQRPGAAMYDLIDVNSYLNCEHRHKFSKGISIVFLTQHIHMDWSIMENTGN